MKNKKTLLCILKFPVLQTMVEFVNWPKWAKYNWAKTWWGLPYSQLQFDRDVTESCLNHKAYSCELDGFHTSIALRNRHWIDLSTLLSIVKYQRKSRGCTSSKAMFTLIDWKQHVDIGAYYVKIKITILSTELNLVSV